MAASRRRSNREALLRKPRRGPRARQPVLGLERLDSRLALSASAQLLGKWLQLQPPAAIAAPAATVAPPAATVRASAILGNRPPVISSVSVGRGDPATGVVTVVVTATDPNRDRLTYTASGATKGRATINSGTGGRDGTVVYTPTPTARHAAAKEQAAPQVLVDTVRVTVFDTRFARVSTTVTVAIFPSNSAPVAQTTVAAPHPSGVVTGRVSATDADGDPLAFSAPASTAKGSVQLGTSGNFTYTPTATARHNAARLDASTAEKSDSFTVTVRDGYGAVVNVPVTVAIAPRNSAPVAGATTVGNPQPEFGVVTGTVRGTDSDGDTLAFSGPAATTKGTLSVNAATGAFTYTPTAAARKAAGAPGATDADRQDSFTVTLADGYGGRTAVPVSVPVTASCRRCAIEKVNLVVNPGAELGDPSRSGYSSVTIPGWTVTGTPTVIKYGATRTFWPIGTSFPMPNLPPFLGFPKAKSGPADGGNQFFGGGNVATGTLTQTVDLRGAATDIDKGAVPYDFSGWFGGYLSDKSGASASVTFLDGNKTFLGSAQLSRVSALERLFQTGFKQRSTSGTLPTGTRYAQVVVTLEDRQWAVLGFPALLGGVDFDYNNAFADNIAFSIGANLPAPPAPTPPVSTVGELDHVFMVYMENKGYTDITGSTKTPFLNSLINAYGHANQYHGLTHPSLPNYYPIVGGTDFGLTYNCGTPCIDADTTLVSNIVKAGKTWKGYAQSLQPGASPLVSSGDYANDDLPFPAFKSIANDPAAVARIVPLEQMAEDLKSVATAPNYAWFAANEDFNGDQFLSQYVPVVLNSAVWKDPTRKSALVVTFDEDNNNTSLGFGNEGNRVVFAVIPSQGAVDAGMRGGAFTATNHYNHYSLLRFIEDSLGLPYLTNNDKFAAPLNEFWDTTTKSGVGSSLV